MNELIERLEGHVETLKGVASGVYSDDIEEAVAELQHMQEVIDRVALIRLDLESENGDLKRTLQAEIDSNHRLAARELELSVEVEQRDKKIKRLHWLIENSTLADSGGCEHCGLSYVQIIHESSLESQCDCAADKQGEKVPFPVCRHGISLVHHVRCLKCNPDDKAQEKTND